MNSKIVLLHKHIQQKYPRQVAACSLTHNNQLLFENIFGTPIGITTYPSDDLPDNHSEAFLNSYSEILDNIKHHVDITNLEEMSGAFRSRLFRGIKESLYRGISGERLIVRILFGRRSLSGITIDTKKLLEEMRAAIGGSERLSVYVGVQNFTKLANIGIDPLHASWNHAKYVAVDSKHLLTGGHNWWGDTYLGKRPVFDLSVRIKGPAANSAHLFSNYLWSFVRAHNNHSSSSTTWCHSMIDGQLGELAPPVSTDVIPTAPTTGDVSVLAIGQEGIEVKGKPDGSPSIEAAYWAIEQASRGINLSQQNLGSGMSSSVMYPEFKTFRTCGGIECIGIKTEDGKSLLWYDAKLLKIIAKKLKDGVAVNIYITNSQAGSYTTGEAPYSIYRGIGKELLKILDRKDSAYVLRQYLKIKTVMTQRHAYWTKAPNEFKANHAKFWSVDDEMFYVGSHNLYPSVATKLGLIVGTGHLQEWGVIVSGQQETKDIQSRYFNPFWTAGHEAQFKDTYLP